MCDNQKEKHVQNVCYKRRKKQHSVKKVMEEVTAIKYVRKSEEKSSILGKHVLPFGESLCPLASPSICQKE